MSRLAQDEGSTAMLVQGNKRIEEEEKEDEVGKEEEEEEEQEQ